MVDAADDDAWVLEDSARDDAADALRAAARDELPQGGVLAVLKAATGTRGGTWRDALAATADLIDGPVATWGERFTCSRCGSGGEPLYTAWAFCPHCRARLRRAADR